MNFHMNFRSFEINNKHTNSSQLVWLISSMFHCQQTKIQMFQVKLLSSLIK